MGKHHYLMRKVDWFSPKPMSFFFERAKLRGKFDELVFTVNKLLMRGDLDKQATEQLLKAKRLVADLRAIMVDETK